ncbi:DUF998 domain-containing protein [Nonomuraea sp. NPDC050394]|uniref:DUF998 domain-containing protein n=1 Tax=Nonomuraea sp. NPDC050394 TaxID=3364363 RepID=UPI0037B0712C
MNRTLLMCGVLAGPLYVLVSLAQAVTREPFDLTRHAASLLSNGDLGWIQIANFVITGALVIAFSYALKRPWAPWLIRVYGLGLIGAGVFVADPALGFPAGTPAGPPAAVSWHGMLHFVAGGIGFLCMIAACLFHARRHAAERRTGWALFSALTGVLFLAAFAGIASGNASALINVSFALAVVLSWSWIAATGLRFLREAR